MNVSSFRISPGLQKEIMGWGDNDINQFLKNAKDHSRLIYSDIPRSLKDKLEDELNEYDPKSYIMLGEVS